MPTSTVPYEILFDFTNDSTSRMSFQLRRHGASNGPTILLQRSESVSLVLTAGSLYEY
ncbi:hypothetical protein FISHEDRAFT_18933, partial [Fistulina hepatica ATCC 64428]